jgi:hypothetical protein
MPITNKAHRYNSFVLLHFSIFGCEFGIFNCSPPPNFYAFSLSPSFMSFLRPVHMLRAQTKNKHATKDRCRKIHFSAIQPNASVPLHVVIFIWHGSITIWDEDVEATKVTHL